MYMILTLCLSSTQNSELYWCVCQSFGIDLFARRDACKGKTASIRMLWDPTRMRRALGVVVTKNRVRVNSGSVNSDIRTKWYYLNPIPNCNSDKQSWPNPDPNVWMSDRMTEFVPFFLLFFPCCFANFGDRIPKWLNVWMTECPNLFVAQILYAKKIGSRHLSEFVRTWISPEIRTTQTRPDFSFGRFRMSEFQIRTKKWWPNSIFSGRSNSSIRVGQLFASASKNTVDVSSIHVPGQIHIYLCFIIVKLRLYNNWNLLTYICLTRMIDYLEWIFQFLYKPYLSSSTCSIVLKDGTNCFQNR